MPNQAPWPSSAPQPPAVDWDALIAEVVAAGAEVPELDWAVPGEDAAAQARAGILGRARCAPNCPCRGQLALHIIGSMLCARCCAAVCRARAKADTFRDDDETMLVLHQDTAVFNLLTKQVRAPRAYAGHSATLQVKA